MQVTIEVHSWLGESFVRHFSNRKDVLVNSYIVDPGGDGKDYLELTLGYGWSKKILEEHIEGCDIPKSMFKVSYAKL